MHENFLKLFFLTLPVAVLLSSEECVKEGDTLLCNYFPTDIPQGILEVEITDFMNFYDKLELNSSMFQSNTWRNVTRLKLRDDTDSTDRNIDLKSQCFGGLSSLQRLEIHIVQDFAISNDTFLGIQNVTTLDVSECGRLSIEDFTRAIGGPEILSSMEELDLSRLSYKVAEIFLGGNLFEALSTKNLKTLTVTNTGISMIRPYTMPLFLPKLELFNLSHSNIGDGVFDGNIDLRHLKMYDFAFANLPKLAVLIPVGEFILSKENLTGTLKELFQLDQMKNYLSIQGINVSAVLRSTSIHVDACFANIDFDIPSNMKELVASYNNLKRIDLKLVLNDHGIKSLRKFDLSNNGLEYLHPSMPALVPNLETVDLSYNDLHHMVKENVSMFEALLHELIVLRYVSFSSNQLNEIPRLMFVKSVELVSIDLSNNHIDQVTFLLGNLRNLKFLDLRNNSIKVLHDDSINNLNSLLSLSVLNENQHRSIVDIRDNPISCSQCDNKHFLQWVINSGIIANRAGVSCIDEKGATVYVTSDVIKQVQKICERRVIIIATSVSMTTVFVIGIIIIVILYRQRKRALKLRNEQCVLDLLKQGKGQYEFAVFLSFCSSDDSFVSDFVDDQLSRALKEMTHVERELVCVGDRNLRPGFFLLDETLKCLERSSVVIAVISDAFCMSNYCHTELDQAYRLRKPILLMFRENVSEELMNPTVRFLYKQNARILWKDDNGRYVLKTSWDNVCRSILDHIVENL